jgi:hypothetical protein
MHNLPHKSLSTNRLGQVSDAAQFQGTRLAFLSENETNARRVAMKVKFTLTMDDVVVEDRCIDQIIMDWETDIDQQKILELSHQWITSQNFLTQRMVGLTRVGESSLTIEPMEEV